MLADRQDASDMAEHENIAKTLKARLSELTGRLAEIDSELHKPLSADSEEQANRISKIWTHLKPLRIMKSTNPSNSKALKAHLRRYLRHLLPVW